VLSGNAERIVQLGSPLRGGDQPRLNQREPVEEPRDVRPAPRYERRVPVQLHWVVGIVALVAGGYYLIVHLTSGPRLLHFEVVGIGVGIALLWDRLSGRSRPDGRRGKLLVVGPEHASRAFGAFARDAGVEAHPHLLRHSLASAMAAAKEPASVIAGQLRHADGGTLASRTYIHQLPQTPTPPGQAHRGPLRPCSNTSQVVR
jgi:integrase